MSMQDDVIFARDQSIRLLIMVQQAIANPTAANIDAVVSGAAAGGPLTPRLSVNTDGESYDWVGYADSLRRAIKDLTETAVLVGGPYEIRTVGRT